MTLEKYMSTLVHENAIKIVVIIRDDAVGTSRLVHENAIKNVLIIRDDDAVGTSTQRPEYELQQIKKAYQRPSFTHLSERNSTAPKLPNRKSSYDDLLLMPEIKESGHNRRSSLDALLTNRKSNYETLLLKSKTKESGRNKRSSLNALPNRKSSDHDLLLQSEIRESGRNRRSSLNSFFPTSDVRNEKRGTRSNRQSQRHKVSPNMQSRRKLIDEISAEVGILFEESQKISRFDHAE
jgi:hypothetical protein